MPYRSPRICKRCKKLTQTPGPRCNSCKEKYDERKHAKEVAYQQSRPTPAQRGYTSGWRKYSRMYRRRHPLCECYKLTGEKLMCGRYSRLVHHLDGNTGNNDPTNHLAMALHCHSKYESKVNRWRKDNDAKRISNQRGRREGDSPSGEITIGKFL